MNFGTKYKTGLNSKVTQEQLKSPGLTDDKAHQNSQSELRGKSHDKLVP